MSNRIAVALLAAGFVLAGCSGSGSDEIGPTDPTSGNGDPGGSSDVGEFHPSFAPLSGVLPFPTDLYFAGSTDGTLNSPVTPFLPNAATLNALDGFSTVASSTVRFSAPIDAATISPATVIFLEVDVDNATKATVGFRRALAYGTDYTARVATTTDSGGATLEIVPLKPLTPSTGGTNVGYLVILTNGLRDTSGNVATPDRDYVSIKDAQPTCADLTGTLNSICLLTGAHLAIASAVGVPADNVVLTYSYSTQSTADVMAAAVATVPDAAIGVQFTGLNVQQLNPAVLPPIAAIADVYVGQLAISYYLDPDCTAYRLVGSRARRPGRSVDEPHALQPGTSCQGRESPDPAVRHRAERGQRPGEAGRGLAGRDLPARHSGQPDAGGRGRRHLCFARLRRRGDRHTASRNHRRCEWALPGGLRTHFRPRPSGQHDRRFRTGWRHRPIGLVHH